MEEVKNDLIIEDVEIVEHVVEETSYTDEEIDAISGATITTNAVVNGVNAGIYYISTLE